MEQQATQQVQEQKQETKKKVIRKIESRRWDKAIAPNHHHHSVAGASWGK